MAFGTYPHTQARLCGTDQIRPYTLLCSIFTPQTVPLSRLAPRLRRSVEGLNLELEGVFVSETPEDQHKVSMFKYSISAWVPAGLDP